MTSFIIFLIFMHMLMVELHWLYYLFSWQASDHCDATT